MNSETEQPNYCYNSGHKEGLNKYHFHNDSIDSSLLLDKNNWSFYRIRMRTDNYL